MKLMATRRLRYNLQSLQPGDEFEAKPRDAMILKAAKKAVDAPPEPAPVRKPPPPEPLPEPSEPLEPPQLADVPVAAERPGSSQEPIAATGAPRRRRTYRRRDMNADADEG